MNAEQLLRGLGATGKLRGFFLAIHMIELAVQDPVAVSLITKAIYPETAKRYGLTAWAVERDLRTVIRTCWEQPDHALLDKVAGRHLEHRPTNSEFLDMTAAYLRAGQS